MVHIILSRDSHNYLGNHCIRFNDLHNKGLQQSEKIQDSVDIEKAEVFAGSLVSLKNYLWELNYHLYDGLGTKDLHLLEQKSIDVIEQIDRYQLFFPDSIIEAQDNLKKILRDCVVRCQEWTDYITDNPDASIEDYFKQLLEAIVPNTYKLISEVIAGIRHSTVS